MDSCGSTGSIFSAGSNDVDDAVGVPKAQWFVAIVNHNSEKTVYDKLTNQNFECFIATQQELRVWRNGRKSKVDRVVIPSTVFIKCTEKERRQIVTLPYINRFMTNRAGSNGELMHKPLAVIPDIQIKTLKFMLCQSDTPVIMSGNYQKGDKVRVVRGKLKGVEGEVLDMPDGTKDLVVKIDFFGCARLSIDPLNLEHVK